MKSGKTGWGQIVKGFKFWAAQFICCPRGHKESLKCLELECDVHAKTCALGITFCQLPGKRIRMGREWKQGDLSAKVQMRSKTGRLWLKSQICYLLLWSCWEKHLASQFLHLQKEWDDSRWSLRSLQARNVIVLVRYSLFYVKTPTERVNFIEDTDDVKWVHSYVCVSAILCVYVYVCVFSLFMKPFSANAPLW